MEAFEVETRGSTVHIPRQNSQIKQEDLDWLRENDLPIVVPVKDVGPEFIRNALFGIPKECDVIFVSGSEGKVGRSEKTVAALYEKPSDRDVYWIEQSNSVVASYLEDNYPCLIEDGKPKQGYREALLIGSFACKSLGADKMGVVDGDNWNPMALREYVTLYARGFREQDADYVSIQWRCKPKAVDDKIEWREEGRTSAKANSWLNRLMSPPAIKSSCAGDHAVKLDFWDKLEHTPNHSGEVNAFRQIIEGDPEGYLMQYKSMSPQFHQYGGEEHIEAERLEVARPIFYSEYASGELKSEIRDEVGSGVAKPLEPYDDTTGVGDDFLSEVAQRSF